jgi:hypothetical protein
MTQHTPVHAAMLKSAPDGALNCGNDWKVNDRATE